MISRKTTNFLLECLMKIIANVYLYFSALFQVDFEPKEKIDDSYTKFNSLNDPQPIIEDNQLNYRDILAEAEDNSASIIPVNRRKPLTVDVEECSKCGAPKEYLYSYGYDDGYQKFKCKLCTHQWAPEKPEERPKNHPTYRCPFCGYALSKEKKRKHFTKYKCRNDNCKKWVNEHKRYRYRAYDVSPAAQTIQNWTVSLAYRLAPKINDLDLPLSGIVAVDETYIKIKGSWHYLFTAIDGKNGCVIAQHLSEHKDAKGAITIVKSIIDQYQGQDFVLVSDMAPVYRAAVHAAMLCMLQKSFLKLI